MLEPEEHLHQFTTAAIAAAIGRAKRLTDLHCIHSSSVESLGRTTARQKKEGAGGEMNSWLSRRHDRSNCCRFCCCRLLLQLLLFLVFVRCTKKVRHKLGHANEVARHAGRSLFVLMGGARKKKRLCSSPARKDVTIARCWKRNACKVHR